MDDLLDVSRITRGTVRLDRRPVAVKDVVDTAVDTWRHLISHRRQQLAVELPDEPLFIDADPTRMAQVVANLLHNAAKFTPEEGRITLSAAEEEGRVAISVRDDGAGIAPEYLERIFELFAQGPPSLDRPQGGLGLGLTLARRLAELHGGTLGAMSAGPGGGSEFVVRLAKAARAGVEAVPGEGKAADARGPRVSDAGRRVLVVDDNADAREALRLLLEDEGHDVRSAGDGPSALESAARFPPDVVLLDIGLPGMDGSRSPAHCDPSRAASGR